MSRKPFPFSEFEPRWQQHWLDSGNFRAPNPGDPEFDGTKPKFYVLDMFPYPSGEGLHVGHVEGYTATDILARARRMQGFNVLHPMGWDAFGLPAEQFAIKTGQHPRVTTERNVARFREQLQAIGFSYDWSREISTTDPGYFRWTQWIFLRLYHSWFNPETNRAEPISTYSGNDPDGVRLAYIADRPVNWCPELGTVLANEEVVDGRSEVGGFPVERRPMRQWMLRITAYAQRLIDELDGLDWPESIKLLQRNWIGRSEGAVVRFAISGLAGTEVEVFTTRPDTLFGATYLVLAPEHPLVDLVTSAAQNDAVHAYRKLVSTKSDLERTELAKVKSGVPTGAHAVNPANGELIPIWIADYVLFGYGTGAIMAVPAHDERDFEFAQQFELPVRTVVSAKNELSREVEMEVNGGGDVSSPHPSPFFEALEPVEIHRGNLPHWQQPGKMYFVTWRLADSLPQAKLDAWRNELDVWLASHPKPWNSEQLAEYHALADERIETWLEAGEGECILRKPEVARIVIDALRHFDGAHYELTGFVVMPNHVHVLVRLFDDVDLPQVMQGWKGFSAKTINQQLERTGAVWQAEYFDRIVRSERHASRVEEYLRGNARQAGLLGSEMFWLKGDETSPLPLDSCFAGEGVAVNSGFLDGLPTVEAKRRMISWLEAQGVGAGRINFKLRDWLFSRQRYWGEPFPIVWDGSQHRALKDGELPVVQPELEDFKPTGTGEPPLAKATAWVRYSETARRETNTMPQWAGSCWYYLRFCDPENPGRFVGEDAERYWMQGSSDQTSGNQISETLDSKPKAALNGGVDLYVGGTEHAVLHLLYARFWHKVLFDLGLVSTREPFHRLVNQGIILGNDGQKMSKSRGNVVSPDEVISEYGADSLRLYEMFMGPLEQMKPWSMKGVEGVFRFLARVWRLAFEENQEGDWVVAGALAEVDLTSGQRKVLHATIKKVTHDIDTLSFNTAIAQMMVCVNEFTSAEVRPIEALRVLLRLLSPFAPHIAEEIWTRLGLEGLASRQPWPVHDECFLVENEVELVIQVNGKLRDRVTVGLDAADPEIESAALASPKVQESLSGKSVVKIVVVRGKLVNVVVR